MSSTFDLRDQPFPPIEGKRRVLVTGAAGRIGSYLAEHSHEQYDLRLMVRGDEAKIEEIRAYGEVIQCGLDDLPGLTDLCEGIDTVVHLAADHRGHAPWEEVLPNNIVGTYNLFTAAKAQGCRRVIFASSIQAVSGYPRFQQVRPEDPVNPPNLYAVSKCFGEALCRCFSNKMGLSGIVLRIGAYQTYESMRSSDEFSGIHWAFVSPRDLTQLIVRCIDDEKLQFAIFYGFSNNKFCKGDLSNARELLGYTPIDDIYADPDK